MGGSCGSGFRVQVCALGFGVQGLGFRVGGGITVLVGGRAYCWSDKHRHWDDDYVDGDDDDDDDCDDH